MSYPVLTYAGADVLPSPSAEVTPIPHPPSDAVEVKEKGWDKVVLSSFTAADATNLGLLLHRQLASRAAVAGAPTVIDVTLCGSQQQLFRMVTGSGTAPDNDVWVRRKRNTVMRFGCSSWFMHCKFGGDEAAFRTKYGLSDAQAADYAIHGGGVPVYVKGVEGAVAVVVVSGLKQHEDHGVVMQVFREHWKAA